MWWEDLMNLMDLLSKSIGVLEKADLAFQKLVSRGNVPKPAAFVQRIPTDFWLEFLNNSPVILSYSTPLTKFEPEKFKNSKDKM